jgi:hypothetical protein
MARSLWFFGDRGLTKSSRQIVRQSQGIGPGFRETALSHRSERPAADRAARGYCDGASPFGTETTILC